MATCSRLPFAPISYIGQKTSENAFGNTGSWAKIRHNIRIGAKIDRKRDNNGSCTDLMLRSDCLAVLSEYRHVLTDVAIVERYPELTAEKAQIALRRLRYVGDVLRSVKSRFDYSRDPKDAKFIELAIAGKSNAPRVRR
jgi:hypothetical protein